MLYINNEQVKAFTKRLRDMKRSDLPLAVRGTLNDLAFDVYRNSLPLEFKSEFTIRNKTFLSSHSGFEKAQGWEILGMKSKAGITPKGSEAAEGLTKQEEGGSTARPFMYMDPSRISGSLNKSVRTQNYINKMGFIKGSPSVSRRTRKSNFVAASVIGLRLNKVVLWESKTGNTAFLIKGVSFSGSGKNRKVKINAIPLAHYEKGFQKQIKPRHFLEKASEGTYHKLNAFYIANAKRRFERAK